MIEYTVEVNIYYQGHRERTEINVIRGQKWSVILRIPQLAHHNYKIDWRIKEVKITRCPKEYRKQWRLKQRELGWKKQKKEEKRKRVIEVKKVVKEQEIWNEDEKVARSEKEAKRLVPECFHKQIHILKRNKVKECLQ